MCQKLVLKSKNIKKINFHFDFYNCKKNALYKLCIVPNVSTFVVSRLIVFDEFRNFWLESLGQNK